MAMVAAAWSRQGQKASPYSDELWEVEWGSVRDMPPKPSWSSTSASSWKGYAPVAAQRPPQATYCLPLGFVVATQIRCAKSGIPLAPYNFLGATHRPTYAATNQCASREATKNPVDASTETRTNARSGSEGDSMDESVDKARAVPASAEELGEGDLPSVGSAAHFEGTCKRCAFFPKGRCRNGADCTHCHFDHAPRARPRRRGRKEHIDVDQPLTAEMTEAEDDVAEMETAVPSSSDYEDEADMENMQSFGLTSTRTNTCPSESSVGESSDSEGAVSPVEVERSSDSEVAVSQFSTTASNPEKIDQPSKRSSLTVSPKSWAAQQRIRRAALESKDDVALDLGRKVRALLNKLTEERFECLCGQILALQISTSAELAIISEEIFEKATTQNGFRALYSELCLRIDAHLSKETSEIGGRAFRKALANECQASFERHLQSTDVAALANFLGDERIEQEMKLKMHRIGNVRFIGELLVRRLLASKLIAPIVQELLRGDESALESLIALLTILAPCFEQKPSLYQAPLKDAFATLCRRRSDKELSLRMRCQLNDLFDARDRKWAARCTAP